MRGLAKWFDTNFRRIFIGMDVETMVDAHYVLKSKQVCRLFFYRRCYCLFNNHDDDKENDDDRGDDDDNDKYGEIAKFLIKITSSFSFRHFCA